MLPLFIAKTHSQNTNFGEGAYIFFFLEEELTSQQGFQ
jgi:hypothetical protein